MNLEIEINETLEYLNSDQAIESLSKDVYWPKWDSPWWRILTLFEIGEIKKVPQNIINALIDNINQQYLHYFPLTEKEIPSHCDTYRNIACHCALGSIYQVLYAFDNNIDQRLSWVRPWFLKYQLSDGGLNCDEEAYLKSNKSSIVSSLPVFEALLYSQNKKSSIEEKEFLNKAAHYLIKHRLICKSDSHQLMNPKFTKLCFPRFYQYDFLRGLEYLIHWRKQSQSTEADETIEYGKSLLKEKMVNGEIYVERKPNDEDKTLKAFGEKWDWSDASGFLLLEQLSSKRAPSKFLTQKYRSIIES